jgi:PTS system ascorbate-specific IIB component
MKKVLVACGNGVGSSLIVKMKVESVMDELGIDCEVIHSSVGQSKTDARNYDIIIVSKIFVPEFENLSGPKVIGLVNIMSQDEIKEKIQAIL